MSSGRFFPKSLDAPISRREGTFMLWTKDGLVMATMEVPALLVPVTPAYWAQHENDKL